MPAPSSPFDDPVTRGYHVVRATLRIAVALECWGAASARLLAGDSFGLESLLISQAGFAASSAASLLDNVAWGLIAIGLVTLVRPIWFLLLPVTAWFGLIAATGVLSGNDLYRPASHAVRYLTPLALLLLDLWPPALKFSLGRAMVALLFLRLGITVSFATQGMLALAESRSNGPLVAQLASALSQVFRWSPTPEQAQTALGVVGGIYVGLALGLLLVRSRAIALLVTLCGGLGAMTYVIAGGTPAWDQTLLHSASAGAPFALFLHWWLAIREQPAITVPA